MPIVMLLLVIFPGGAITAAAQFPDRASCEAKLKDVGAFVAKQRDEEGRRPLAYAATCAEPVEVQQGVDL